MKLCFRSPEEVKLNKSMAIIMNFSVVFFTRRFLTNNKQGEGSGQFTHAYDLKPDQILLPLVASGLIVGGDFLKYAHRGKNDEIKYRSFCKQLPSAIENNPRMKQAFEVITNPLLTNIHSSLEAFRATLAHKIELLIPNTMFKINK